MPSMIGARPAPSEALVDPLPRFRVSPTNVRHGRATPRIATHPTSVIHTPKRKNSPAVTWPRSHRRGLEGPLRNLPLDGAGKAGARTSPQHQRFADELPPRQGD